MGTPLPLQSETQLLIISFTTPGTSYDCHAFRGKYGKLHGVSFGTTLQYKFLMKPYKYFTPFTLHAFSGI